MNDRARRAGRWVRAIAIVGIAMVTGAGGRAIAEPPVPPAAEQRARTEPGAPLAPDKAAAAMTLPPGFAATVFAAEPDVHQPIALAVDHRGRVWVAENDAFPSWSDPGRDKVVVFGDADGDGRADRRTVVLDGLHYVTAVLPAPGGVWVLDCPKLMYVPLDATGERPAGPPEVRLDGFSHKGVHNLPNSLTWGPDGWLYGCNGTIFDCAIGAPGAPPEQRVKINRGVWRYHPRTRAFESFAEGTANPWGLDYDARGQLFMTNNVVAHLWHVVQGGQFPRVNGWGASNPQAYALLPTVADHLHWGGGDWTASRGGQGAHSVAGGGHSHAGCLIYQGTAFPPEYRGTLLTCNTHGHRVNNDALVPKGAGFVATHRPDFLLANDPWFKGVSLQAGPAGEVYAIDWSDTGECHDYDATDRAHGRVFRVAYTAPGTAAAPAPPVDLTRETTDRLIDLQTSADEWHVRQARLVLRARGLEPAARDRLIGMLTSAPDPLHRLRAMWTLHGCEGVGESRLLAALADPDAHVRAWAIQLLAEDRRPSAAALGKFATLAAGDPSPVVRLYLACAAARVPVGARGPVLAALVAKTADAVDATLPAAYWYALEPVIAADPKAVGTWLAKVRIPALREWVVRRAAAR